MNSQGSRVFYDFFFISFFFFRSISNCLFVGRFYVAGNEFVLKGLPDVHIYIYIHIFDRSVHAVYTRIDDGDDDPVFLINSPIDALVRSP